MNIDQCIEHIRANQTTFKLVAGAAEYEALKDEVNPQLPALFIIPLHDEVEDRQGQSWTRQIVKESIQCVMVLDNRADRRGQAAATGVEALKYLVYSLLYTWRSPASFQRAPRGLYYTGGGLLFRDFARLEWELVFTQDVWISSADGWQLTGDRITQITISDPNNNVGGDIQATPAAMTASLNKLQAAVNVDYAS